jgi:RTX calcium-binding nonapeptide repeat (4 copies)
MAVSGSAQFIPVVLPDEPIGGGTSPGFGSPFLGHAGFILVQPDGTAFFYEYGHFPNGGLDVAAENSNGTNSNVRRVRLGRVDFDSSGNITQTSLQTALDTVFGSSTLYPEDPGMVVATPYRISQTQYANIQSSVNTFIASIANPASPAANYSLIGDPNCINFVYDMANDAAGNGASALTISTSQSISVPTSIPSVAADNILAYADSIGSPVYEYFSARASDTGQSSITPVSNLANLSANEDFAIQIGHTLENGLGALGNAAATQLYDADDWISREVVTLTGGGVQWTLGDTDGDTLTATFGNATTPISIDYADSSENNIFQLNFASNGSDALSTDNSSGTLTSILTDNINGTSVVQAFANLPEYVTQIVTNYAGEGGIGTVLSTEFISAASDTLTLGAGTYSDPTYSAISSVVDTPLEYDNLISLGNLSFNANTDADGFTLADGLSVTLGGITSDIISAVSPSLSPLTTLLDYLSDLGDSTTESALNTANIAYEASFGITDSSTRAVTWAGTTLIGTSANNQGLTASLLGNDKLYAGSGTGDELKAGLGQDMLIGSINGDTNFVGAGASTDYSLSDGSTVIGYGTGNTLQVLGDISGSTVTGIQSLDSSDITLTASQFNEFTTLIDGGTINAATGGTYNVNAIDSSSAYSYNMTALSNAGTTLIANQNGADQTLTASASGADTLEAGNGNDTLVAGGGVDTLIGGDETIFMATNGLAAGSIVEGNGEDNTLTTSGDISGVSVSGVNELITNNITLTASEWSAFSSLTGNGNGGTINAASGGTYDLDTLDSIDTNELFNMNALSNSGTTLIGNDADGEILTASATGNDTLTAGNGAGDQLIAGGGTDTLTGGTGGGDTFYAGTGIDTITSNGADDTFVAQDGLAAGSVLTGDGNILEATGNISGATITGMAELELEGNVILTSAQYAEFSAVDSSDGTYTILGTSSTAASAAALAGTTGYNPVYVSDTAANVKSNIANLETVALAGEILSISFTDSGTPSLSFTASQVAADIDAIATFTGAFTLTVSDTAANVATNIDALGELAAIGDLTSIALTDGGTPTLDLSATQVGDDAAALALITSAYTVAVSDTGADVAADIDALQTLAIAGTLSSITLTDSTTPTLSITQTQLSGDSGALAAIGSSYDIAVSEVLAADAATVAATTGVTSVSVADTAANVQSNLSALETLAASTVLASIFFTDTSTPTLSVTETQLTSDADALALIAGSYNLTVTSVTAADAATVAAETNVTTVSISDTAANVVANLDELQALAAAGELGSITLTDSGTPTLSLSQAQLATDAGAIAAISGSYHISLSSVLAGSAATVAAESGVTSVAVSDTAANVVANLAALETLAADSELASITLIDPGTPVLTVTASQLSSDSTALGLISGSYDLAVTGVSAANAATVAAESHVTSVSVSDTAANVASNLNSLQSVAGSLAVITLTDGGTPTLNITGTQFSSDSGALGAITSAYHLTVTSVLAANAATVGANSHVTSITISDTAANVASHIDSIESVESKLATFSLTDSGTPTMTISYTQLINDATALGLISGTFHIAVSSTLAANAATAATKTHVTSILVSDTAAHVVTSLSSLETLATAGTLTSVSFTDSGTPTLTLTYTQLTGNTALLATFATAYDLAITSVTAANAATVGANTHVTSISVSDTSANIATNINSLESVAGVLTAITATDGGSQTITITAAQANSDYAALSQLTGSYHLGVTDTAANISANIDALQTLYTFATSKLTITASDGASNNIIVTAAQAGNDALAISRSSGSFHVEVRDSAANISADFAALQALDVASKLTDVVFTDSGTPTLPLTYTQFTSGSGPAILSDISGSYHLTISAVPYADVTTVLGNTHVTSITVSDTAATISTNLNTLQTDAAAGTVTGVAVTNGSTTAVTFTYTQLSSDSTVLALFTGTYSFKVSAVTVANAATVLAVSHVSSISISDTAANVISSINTLETYASALELSGIILTDGGTPAMTATATQGASDVTAFNLISSTYHLTVSDTAANVQTNLNGLQALYAAIGSSDFTAITLTDGTEPTLTISATQATSDASAIGKITSAYHLTVSDTAANVVSNLAGLETLGTKLTTITLTDGGTPNLAITGTQYTADITAINKITSAYTLTVSAVTGANITTVAANTHVSSFTVSDTAANISTYIDTLQAQSAKITSINITNHTVPLTITQTQLTNDATALGLISVSYSLSVSGVSIANSSTILGDPNVVEVGISDTAANISANIDALQTLEADGELASITITSGGKVGVTATQATNDAAAINTITGSVNVTVTDTSANILANLAGLKVINAELSSIVLSDGGTPTLSITGAQYDTYITEINKISSAYALSVSSVAADDAGTIGTNTHTSSYAVADTAANVANSSNLGSMELRVSNLSSITFTDSGTPTFSISGAEDTSDASAIAKIASTYDETVTATGNTTQTLTGTGSINTISFSGEAQGVTANLSTGTATTVHSGTTNTYTLSGFENLTGSTLADTLTAGSSGGILTGDGGADTYVLNASSGYDIAQDTATHLNGTTIQNFSVLDGIDLTNIAYGGGTATLGFVENGADTQGTLTVSDGTHTAALTLLGNYTLSSFQDVSDGASGTLVAMASTTHLTAILAAAQA